MSFDPQLGVAEETTWGTAVTPTRFYDFGDESIDQDVERVEYMGLRPNKQVMGTSNWVPGRIGIAGKVTLPVMNKGMGLLFKHCLGAVATTTPTGATTTRDHKCKIGTLDGKGLTVQVGRPFTGGAAQAFTYSGCKVDKWSLSHDTKSQLMLELDLDGSAETTATGLASASYAAGTVPYAFTKGVLSIGGSSFDVMDWSLNGDNALATDRYYIRSGGGNKKEQIGGGGLREYKGTFTADFTDLTQYNRFVNGTTASLVAVYTGGIIEGALSYQITVSCLDVRYDGDTPNVGGFEMLKQTVPFKVLDGAQQDGPVVVVVRSDDATP